VFVRPDPRAAAETAATRSLEARRAFQIAVERSPDVSEADDPFHVEAGADREMTARMLAVDSKRLLGRGERASRAGSCAIFPDELAEVLTVDPERPTRRGKRVLGVGCGHLQTPRLTIAHRW
jgi:hypothetical protein